MDKQIYQDLIKSVETEYGFTEGYELLSCPWNTIGTTETAFIALNPGKPPDVKELRYVSNEQGNSYEIDRFVTKSPITEQFFKLCKFIDTEPRKILTGMACPFRGGHWNHFSNQQKDIGLSIGRQFWSEALDDRIKLIIVLGDDTKTMIVDLKNARLDYEVEAKWQNTKNRRFITSTGTKIIQLPHLSRFKIFSREECLEPLKEIFEI